MIEVLADIEMAGVRIDTAALAEYAVELNRKLADFSSPTDTSMEETFENREQIEISRYYERMPKPTIIATEEFLDHELTYRMAEPKKEQ